MKFQTNIHPEVVVVTGASAGVGRAIVQAFAKRGAHIGLLARGHAGLEGARREVEELGGKALVISTDVADSDQVEAAAEHVEQTFGPIDLWINGAMTSVFSPAKEMEPEEYKRVTEVTYLGQVYGTLAALKRMLPRNHGKIIQIGSALAYYRRTCGAAGGFAPCRAKTWPTIRLITRMARSGPKITASSRQALSAMA